MSDLNVDEIRDAATTGGPAFPNGFLGGAKGIAGPDSNTTLSDASERVQIVSPTANRVYTMPTTFRVGDIFKIVNTSGTFTIDVDAGDASNIGTVPINGVRDAIALTANPATNSDWVLV